jgi:hypothetical protein
MMKLLKSLALVLSTFGLPATEAAKASPAVRQVECERIDPTTLIPRTEQAFRKTFKHQIARGEISADAKLTFGHDEFSFNQGTWLLPFTVTSAKGQRTYFALVNCITGVEFSVGDKIGGEEP